jgi:hypothetical protein
MSGEARVQSPWWTGYGQSGGAKRWYYTNNPIAFNKEKIEDKTLRDVNYIYIYIYNFAQYLNLKSNFGLKSFWIVNSYQKTKFCFQAKG